MTFRHVLVSLAVTCLCACSSDDTIVSLNVTATDRVPAVEQLHVTFKQGSHSYAYTFTPPQETSDSGESIKNSFYQRITLPGDWEDSGATVSVEATQEGDAPFTPPLVDETRITIRPNGVVAAFVKLDIPEEMPMTGGAGEGGGGAGGAPASEGGAPGAAGAVSSGGVPSEGGVPASEGGAASAGEAGAGGAG
jgi:hypothetical protein